MRAVASLLVLCLLAACSQEPDTPWTLVDGDRLSGRDAVDCVWDCGINYSTFYARPMPDGPAPSAAAYRAAFRTEPVFGLRTSGHGMLGKFRSELSFFRAPLAEDGPDGWFVRSTVEGDVRPEERRTTEAECPGLAKATANLSTLLKVREHVQRFEHRSNGCSDDCHSETTFWVRAGEGRTAGSESWRQDEWPDYPPAIPKIYALLYSCWADSDPTLWPMCPSGTAPGPTLRCSPQG